MLLTLLELREPKWGKSWVRCYKLHFSDFEEQDDWVGHASLSWKAGAFSSLLK